MVAMGKQSEERLIHFQCGFCRQWWTIGDAPKERTHWYCPGCGKEGEFITE